MFFEIVTSSVRSLINLGIETYGSLLYPVISKKLNLEELRLIVSRNNCADNNWDFTKIIDPINIKLNTISIHDRG